MSETKDNKDNKDTKDTAGKTEGVVSGSARRTLPAVAGAVLAVLVVAALVLWLSTDDDAVSDTAASPSATTTDEPTDQPSDRPSADPSDVAEVDPSEAADEASAAGVPALVPDAFAERYGVVSAASFDAEAGLWQLEVTTDDGVVVVRQDTGPVADLLATHAPDVSEGAPVDLSRWGLGTWDSWSGAETAVISTDLPGGGAMASGPDADTVTRVVRSLLTHEDNRGGEQD